MRGGLRGTGPALAGNVGTGWAFALSREGGLGCRRSNARSGPIPLRLAYLGGLRGIGPTLAGNVGTGWDFALSRDGNQDVDVPILAPVRSRSAWRIWVGSAGPVLRSQGTLGQAGISRCRARGIRVSTFQCSLRSGPAPPGVFGWAPRDRSCARRERWGRLGFRAVARRGSGCRRSNARSGPVPLPLRGGAGRLGGGEAFGVPQRGTAYQPGVKPRVWRTTEAF